MAKHAGEVEAAPLRIKYCKAGVVGATQGKDGVGRLAEFGCAAIGDDTEGREWLDGDEDFASIVKVPIRPRNAAWRSSSAASVPTMATRNDAPPAVSIGSQCFRKMM